MENIIGVIRMYPSSGSRKAIRIYFPKKVVAILGNSIVFNIKKMKIRRASIDDVKTFTISNLHTSTAVEDPNIYYGHYNLVQKNEDEFKLKRIPDELCGSS